MINQTLNNRYKITSRIGKGAMGTVYRAADVQTGQDVALKIIASDLVVEPDMLERFKREGEALRQLKHPNIVGFIDAFQHDETYMIVMEHVSGGSLYELLKKGVLPVEQARQIALDLCDALIRVDRLNIIHRDIKPENILIDADGTPKLADFGVARLSEGTRMTRSGMQVGTPYYMAPEAWEGQTLDPQADIWSLGVVFFEMLAGQVPFGGDTGAAVMTKVLTTQPPDLKKLRADVPPKLVQTIRRMLTRDKKRRYPTMREVGVDLERSQITTANSPAKNTKSPRWLPASISIGLVLIVSVVWLAMNSQSTQPTPQVTDFTTTNTPRPAATTTRTPALTSTPNPLELGEWIEQCGSDLCIVSGDGSSQALGLSQDYDLWNFGANWSPDGAQIVFSACLKSTDIGGGCTPDLFIASRDGDTITPLIIDPNSFDAAPVWSPDGQWIAYSNPGGVAIIRPDGTSVAELTNIKSLDLFASGPSWSPDSQHIATVGHNCDSTTCYSNRIFHMNTDGSDFRLLYYSPDVQIEDKIAWSPDGKQVAVKLTDGQAYAINIDCQSDGLNGCPEDSRTPIPDIPVDWLPAFRPQWLSVYADPQAAILGCGINDHLLFAEDFEDENKTRQIGQVETAPDDSGLALHIQGVSGDFGFIESSIVESRIRLRVLPIAAGWILDFRNNGRGQNYLINDYAGNIPTSLVVISNGSEVNVGTGFRLNWDVWNTLEVIWETPNTMVVYIDGREVSRYVGSSEVIERGAIKIYVYSPQAEAWFDDIVVCGQE